MAHCPSQTLGSWDHEEWVQALHHVGGLGRQRRAFQSWRRSQSSSRQCSQMPTHERQPQTTSPHTRSRCPHGATSLPCATMRCYCSTTVPHDTPTTPKVASVVNVPLHAQSSHSSEGTTLASLHQEEVLEDDFRTQHTPVRRVKQQGDSSEGTAAVKHQPEEGPNAPEEAWGSRPYTAWTSVRRKRCWKQLTPLGG